MMESPAIAVSEITRRYSKTVKLSQPQDATPLNID